MKKIDARTDEEKALGPEASVTLGLTIVPDGEGVMQVVGINTGEPKIVLDLTAQEDGSYRYGLLAGAEFNDADGLDILIDVMETYVTMLKNPAVRHAFVEERIQPTQPTLFGEDEHAPEPGA